MSLVLMYM